MGRFGVRVGAVVVAMATALGVVAGAAVTPAGAVGATTSTTTLSAMASPFACDQRVTAMVTVASAPAPTGTVQFFDGATAVGTPVTLANTAALSKAVTSSLLGLGPGPHTISVTYSGDATYASSSSVPQSVTFAPYMSIASVAANPASARAGYGVSFPATIAVDPHCYRKPTGTTHPTGAVTYREGATVLGSGSLVNGYANFTTGALAVGTHTISVSYGGDALFAAAAPSATQASITAAGSPSWRASTAGGPSQGSASLLFGGLVHVWYYDPVAHTLNHGWWNGTTWSSQTLDGGVSGPNGRVADDVGRSVSAVVYHGLPHVYYDDATVGDLREAYHNATGWHFGSLDGFAGPRGRTNGDVGLDSAPVVISTDQLNVFYRQQVDATHTRLRRAWTTPTGWSFAQLDPGANTGRSNTAVAVNNVPHVFSYTGSNLRHAWFAGNAWHYENLDGTQAGPNGQVSNNVGAYARALVWNGAPHVWYQQVGAPAKLRHAWWTGTAWRFETVDGAANTTARAVGADVGYDITVMLFNNVPHVWYRDATNHTLRHAAFAGGTWHFDVNDGYAGPLGQRVNVGVDTSGSDSSVVFNGVPYVFYTDGTTQELRRAWYA